MRFTFAATAALFGAALAAPAPQAGQPEIRELVRITDFFAHKSGASASAEGKVDSISFKMHSSRIASDAGVSCTATAAEGEDSIKFKPEYYNCDGAKDNDRYAFELVAVKGQSVFELYVIHQTAVAFGFQGNTSVPTYCHSGGLDTMVCQQVANVTVPLHL